MAEAEAWLAVQPKTSNGKVSIWHVIQEGRKRGYCICPKPLRQMIDLTGLMCSQCGKPESRQSWEFWYGK